MRKLWKKDVESEFAREFFGSVHYLEALHHLYSSYQIVLASVPTAGEPVIARCPECKGRGYTEEELDREQIFRGRKPDKLQCDNCHGLGIARTSRSDSSITTG